MWFLEACIGFNWLPARRCQCIKWSRDCCWRLMFGCLNAQWLAIIISQMSWSISTNKRERCLVLTKEKCVHVEKGVDILDLGQAISLMHVRNDDRTNDQKRIIWQIVQTRWMWASWNQFLIGLREVKIILLVVEISLINLVHLSYRTNNWACCLVSCWDKKLEGGGGDQLVCT